MCRFSRTSLALERKGKEAVKPTGSIQLLSELSASSASTISDTKENGRWEFFSVSISGSLRLAGWAVNPFYSRLTLVCSMRSGFHFGLVCPSSPFECYRGLTSPSKRAGDSQNFWRLSNTDDPVYVHRWAISPALRWRSSEREKRLSNRLAASSFFQSSRRNRCRLSPIQQLICQISQLIFDRSHVNASHDVPACKVPIDLRTMDRLCVHEPNGRVSGQGNGEWTVRMLFSFHLWQSGAEQSIPFARDLLSSVHAWRFSFLKHEEETWV